jgi:protein involved in polysaccharide export with SLBB domain
MRLLVLSALFFAAPSLARAQNPPSPTEAQRMLETNPLLLQQLRARILSSGLTPEQIRARLRAEGYPESLLDAYIPGSSGTGAEIVNAGTPDDVLSAVRQLGIVDTVEAANLRCATIDAQDSLTAINDTSATGRARRAAALESRARCLARLDSLTGKGLSPADSVRLKAQSDSGFVIFGLSTFRSQTTQFDPNLSGPVDANYRLGPGDQLVLILTGDVSQAYQLPVTREGFIVVPQAGQIYVNNLTLGQLEDILYSRLGRVYSGVRRGPGATTRFSINVSRIRSNQIYVVGDVLAPGSYRISSAGTALSALYAALGPTDNGSLRNVQIKRAGKAVGVLDVYDYLINGDASHDARLQLGDVVFVPVHMAHVRVVGEVVRPATYELKPGETLADAIRFAGGFTPTAARTRVQIERIQAPNQRGEGGRDRVTIDVASNAFGEGSGPSIPVLAGDVIRVFKVAERVRNRISIAGNVWHPGAMGLAPGMTVSQALRAAGGVKPDSYLGQVLVTRLNSDSTRVQLHATLADTTGRVIGDFPLHEDDQVRVYSVSEFRPVRYVAITGAVNNSGQVPYREGMTVRDLILQAGGLEQSADLREAEIARLPADRRGGATATTSRVPLDSSYIFERGPDGKYFGPPGLPAANGSGPEIQLRPYDNVLIFRQPNWELQRTAVVSGEVTRPGTYSLKTKTERISDLIARAGGLTPEAYADGVTFYRANDKVGRIGIALPEILRNPRSRDNLQLQDGDSIFIPRFNAVVNVKGAVNSPVAVTYVPGRSLEYYVRAAGGITRKGDIRYAYVTQPNGKVEATSGKFIFKSDPRPRPGSTVYVPERDPNERRTDYIASIGSLAQVAASLLALAIAIRR